MKVVSIPINVSGGVTQTTSYQYDVLGRLKTILDANQHSTKFEYDLLGRQSKKIWPDNSFELYGYDLVGNRTSQQLTAPSGTTSGLITNTYQYDNMNRLSQLNYGDNSRVITMSYTATGQRQTITDSLRSSTTQYSYDKRNRVTSITQPGSQVLKVEYQWDASSNRTTMTATAGSTPKVTSYTYDDALRLSTVKGADDGANQTTYNYDPVGLRVGLTMPNGISITYGYNSLNRLTNITQKNSGGTVLASYTYTLDPVGNRTKVDEFGGNYNQWLYDDSYRLISETRKVSSDPITTTTFAYDKTGNRLSYSTNGSLTTSYLYNELDQLLSEGSKLYSYDKRGNLSGVSGGTYYTWDVMDRLIGATVPGGSASYLYDQDGRRVKQTIGASVTNFLWDTQSAYGDVTLETDSSNAIQNSYVLGNGELLSQKRSGSNTEYFLMDGHSGVRSLTNNSGAITENYRYDAFGNLQGFSGTPSTKYLYTGQQFDSLTSLYDLRARYYNPQQGRFLSRDIWPVNFNNPIELDRYGYSASNPINYNDPSGLLVDLSAIFNTIKRTAIPALVSLGRSLAWDILIELASSLLMSEADRLHKDVEEYFTNQNIRYPSFTIAVAKVYELNSGNPVTYVAFNNFKSTPGSRAETVMDSAIQFLEGKGIKVSGGRAQNVESPLHAEDNLQLLIEANSAIIDQSKSGGIAGAVSHSDGICSICQTVEGTTYFVRGFGIIRQLRNINSRLFIAGKNLEPRLLNPPPPRILPPPSP